MKLLSMPNLRPLLLLCVLSCAAFAQTANLGIFTQAADVGAPAIAGSTVFLPTTGQYRITGAGANIWGKKDQFQFAWREIAGNFEVSATLRFLGQGNEHRKAGIMIRQSPDPDVTYADVLIHGSGMPALQWRSKNGEDTNAFDLPFDGPGTFRLRMVRIGVKMYLFLGKEGAEPKEIAHTEVSFQGPLATAPVQAGLVVCSHNAAASDTVLFSDVSITNLPADAKAPTAAAPNASR